MQNIFIILIVVTACMNVVTAPINGTYLLNPDLATFSFFGFFVAGGGGSPQRPLSMSMYSEYSHHVCVCMVLLFIT
jgi:hypothetical protein